MVTRGRKPMASRIALDGYINRALGTGKPVYTFDHPANFALLQAGAKVITRETDWKRIRTRIRMGLADKTEAE